ncbi:transposon Ty3-I Gag-Pol polyprotein [Trichonephila clavipes]|nr:transposon Ty3-I Gag-Pol polyprotein [Trichonephila clavipes]
MPTEQEAKPAVVTPSLQQWRSPSSFRGAPGEDPLKWLKEYDRVANFNKWDDMMCLANVYFFLDGTARQWYVNNEDALDSWEAFKNGLSGLFGGAVFRSRLVSSLVDLCNIDHRFTTAYHPQTNGLTERFNKTLADMLSMYVDVEQKNWDEILPFVTFAYNTAEQETTGFIYAVLFTSWS